MGSVADFDLGHVRERIGDYRAAVFSRFYAYPWAPKNVFSYFWGRLARQLEKDYDLAFSFNNPNLGFRSGSYRGCNWLVFALEDGTRYMYDEDGNYRTMRYCLANPARSYRSSAIDLHPVSIWVNVLRPEARVVVPEVPYLFNRPKI